MTRQQSERAIQRLDKEAAVFEDAGQREIQRKGADHAERADLPARETLDEQAVKAVDRAAEQQRDDPDYQSLS